MSISFEGVGQVAATFALQGEGVTAGMAVALVDDGTVGLGADGTRLCGVVLGVEADGMAAVQIAGLAQVAYSGSAPTPGWATLGCDGAGGVKSGSGGDCLVVSVDEDSQTAVIKL